MDGLRQRPPLFPPEPPAPTLPPPKARPSPGRAWGRFFAGAAAFFFLIALVFAGFFLYRITAFSQSLRLSNEPISFLAGVKEFGQTLIGNKHALRGTETGRINVLLLGRAGERYPGKNLTDTIMVLSINTETRKIALLSLPRDLYAPAGSGLYTRLNALYQYGLNQNRGVEILRASVEEVTGEPLHYFAMIDFDGFEKAVDILGGVTVEVERDIYDPRYPGKNYSYETFEIKAGRHHLDGKTALKYVRERHADPEGDFGRAKRQQQVMQALKDQAWSSQSYLNIFTLEALLSTVEESVKTDMTLPDLEAFLRLGETLDTENISTFVVDAWKKESLLRTSHVMVGETRAFILVPRVGNFSEIRDVSANIFDLAALEKRRRNITAESPSVLVVSSPREGSAAGKLREYLAEELGFSPVSVRLFSALARTPEESIIVDKTGLAKPFSLDEVLKRLPLEKRDTLPTPLAGSAVTPEADFVIVVGETLAEAFAFEGNLAETELPLDAVALPPQPKKKK